MCSCIANYSQHIVVHWYEQTKRKKMNKEEKENG